MQSISCNKSKNQCEYPVQTHANKKEISADSAAKPCFYTLFLYFNLQKGYENDDLAALSALS
jgi:hypothetical protein